MSIEKFEECKKCGVELLVFPEEIEAGTCIGCMANKGGGNDPETAEDYEDQELEKLKKQEQSEYPINPKEGEE